MEAIKGLSFIDTLLPLAVIIFIIGTGVVLLNLHFQKNLFAQKLKEEELKNKHRNDLLRSSIHAEEEERKRIAQDLHDELGAVLSIMRMNMVMLEQKNQAAGESLLNGLQNVRQLSESALTSIRSISHRLMPPQMEAFGLIKTLESVISQIDKTGKINIELNAPSYLTELGWEVKLGLYRVIMELINNTIKHANAKHVKIDIACDGQYITCHYTDDGVGLHGKNIANGLGHKSIDGRISSLEGTFEMGSAEAGGFYAVIKVPVGS